MRSSYAGEIAGWTDTEKIDRVRRAHAQSHSVGQNSTQTVQDKGSNVRKYFSCVYFSKGVCLQRQTHENKGVIFQAPLLSLLNKEVKAFQHLQVECRKAQNNTQNGSQKECRCDSWYQIHKQFFC